MEVETPTLTNFDFPSQPPFPYSFTVSVDSAVQSHELLSSDFNSIIAGDSPPTTGQNSVDTHSPVNLSTESKFPAIDAQERDGVGFPVGEKLMTSGGPEIDDFRSEAKPEVLDGVERVNSESGVDSSESIAALKMQKVYRSYRTRRKLADSVVVAEEFWWRSIDSARLNLSTISFFNIKPETAPSRWKRIRVNASKVGKGLSEDSDAQQLAFEHWIEAIDPRHRYGHSLHYYYEEWSKTDSGEPFFYWLDVGEGRVFDHKECPRSKLKQQCIEYLGPLERELYEYIFVDGKIRHRQTDNPLDTTTGPQGAKWIFVMSASKNLYAGVKKKGVFHHSSFLSGGATVASGRLEAELGILKSISAYSGHYHPTDDRLDSFLSILKKNGVNLDNVQIYKGNKDFEYNCHKLDEKMNLVKTKTHKVTSELKPKPKPIYERTLSGGLQGPQVVVSKKSILKRINSKKDPSSCQLADQLSLKWSTGVGPRIGCVADYPPELRKQALEFVKLSPRVPPTPSPVRHRSRLSNQETNTDNTENTENTENGFYNGWFDVPLIPTVLTATSVFIIVVAVMRWSSIRR